MIDRRTFMVAAASTLVAAPALAKPDPIASFWKEALSFPHMRWTSIGETNFAGMSYCTVIADRSLATYGFFYRLLELVPPGFAIDMLDHRRKLEIIFPTGKGPAASA